MTRRIALFGATGGVGRRLLVRLLLAGHRVTAVHRAARAVVEHLDDARTPRVLWVASGGR